jgi:rhodanese-related sulfurtransferase
MKPEEFYRAKLEYETDAWDLFLALKAQGNTVVIDARSEDAYAVEHIPSAISFPHRTMTEESVSQLDKTNKYITYCDGIGCNASTKAALKLSQMGFTVKELLGGLDWWKRDGYPTAGSAGVVPKHLVCGCE